MYWRIFLMIGALLPFLEYLIVNWMSPLTLTLIVTSQVITGIVGIYLLRQYDIYQLSYVEAEWHKGNKLVKELWDETLIMFAAIMLLFPGVLTDVIGGLLLVASIRNLVVESLFYDSL